MQINSQEIKNQISESHPHKSEPLIDVICQKLNQICTTSVKISGRIIQKEKKKQKKKQFELQRQKQNSKVIQD